MQGSDCYVCACAHKLLNSSINFHLQGCSRLAWQSVPPTACNLGPHGLWCSFRSIYSQRAAAAANLPAAYFFHFRDLNTYMPDMMLHTYVNLDVFINEPPCLSIGIDRQRSVLLP